MAKAKTEPKQKPKAECPISRKEFNEGAKALPIRLGERDFLGDAKEFSTGSVGWGLNEKMKVLVGDKQVNCQVSVNVTVIGSKDLPK